jgi:hypothetical protein
MVGWHAFATFAHAAECALMQQLAKLANIES